MRRPLALVSVLLALLCLAGTTAAAYAQQPATPPLALSGGSGEGTTLSRLDPVSLAPQGPQAVIPEWHNGYDIAPDGRQAVFTVATNGLPSTPGTGRVGVRVMDLTTMELVAEFRTGIAGGAVGWLTPRRIVAVVQGGGVFLADPVTGQVTRTGQTGGDCIDPPNQDTTARALVLLLGRRLYTVDREGRVRSVAIRGAPDHCWRLGLAVNRARERAHVVGLGAQVAEVNLRNLRVTYHALPVSRARHVDRTAALSLGADRLVAAHVNSRNMPKGVELVDVRAGTRRMIDPGAGQAVLVGSLLLTYDGRYAASPGGSKGLRAFNRAGALRFSVLATEVVRDVQVLGRYAYARVTNGLRIVDLRTRRVASRSALDSTREIVFLTPRGAGR